MSLIEPEPRRLLAWMQALDQIEEALRQSLAQAVEPAAASPSDSAVILDVAPLRQLDERLARLASCLDQVERDAADADARLIAGADALREWTTTMAAARQRLADWTARMTA